MTQKNSADNDDHVLRLVGKGVGPLVSPEEGKRRDGSTLRLDESPLRAVLDRLPMHPKLSGIWDISQTLLEQ